MAFTYSSLTSAIQAWTENDSTEFSNQLDTIIAMAEEQIYRDADLDKWREISTAGTADGQEFYDKPTGLVITRFMRIIDTADLTDPSRLEQKDPSFLTEYWPDRDSTGKPRYWADWDDDTYILAPTPDDTYTLESHYTVRPDGLSAATTSTWLSDNAGNLLLYACLIQAAGFEQNFDPDDGTYQHWTGRYQEELARLIREENTWKRYGRGRYGEPR